MAAVGGRLLRANWGPTSRPSRGPGRCTVQGGRAVSFDRPAGSAWLGTDRLHLQCPWQRAVLGELLAATALTDWQRPHGGEPEGSLWPRGCGKVHVLHSPPGFVTLYKLEHIWLFTFEVSAD